MGLMVVVEKKRVNKRIKIKKKAERNQDKSLLIKNQDPPPPKTLRPIYVYVSRKKKLLENKK